MIYTHTPTMFNFYLPLRGILLGPNVMGIVSQNSEDITNAMWIGLLTLEALMILGVAIRGIAKRVSLSTRANAY